MVARPDLGSNSSGLAQQPGKLVFCHSISAGRTTCECSSMPIGLVLGVTASMFFLHDAAMIAPLGAIIAPARRRVAGLVAGLAPLFGCRRKPTGSTIVTRSLKDWLTNFT